MSSKRDKETKAGEGKVAGEGDEPEMCVICAEEIKERTYSVGKKCYKDARFVSPCCSIPLHLSCALKWKLYQNECPHRCSKPWTVPAADVAGFIHCPTCGQLGSLKCCICEKYYDFCPIHESVYKCVSCDVNLWYYRSAPHPECKRSRLPDSRVYFACHKCDKKYCPCITFQTTAQIEGKLEKERRDRELVNNRAVVFIERRVQRMMKRKIEEVRRLKSEEEGDG
eukprot:CAMPEP_0201507698 /NCGR_PEP_ID=MMETSP0161_2-20130828/1290_1 /ASSEMBLY_ACC=CAM_ASM_000251 /TAXON_ID=180227 /ORGANISM="Neoparamoeba aestuarina, Strain SoJaBio B1-5/56/2" /LENGTH=224 /DNA_ID=CAMNT_0047902135 /DNA_START=178 /DNA_END=848 /DNA_ORIENTATION=-